MKNNQSNKFYESYLYIQNICNQHGLSTFDNCTSIQVVKVNPSTGMIDDNEKLNTKVAVWLEFGFRQKGYATHDPRCDCGADTFEQAVIILAKLIKKHYE